MLTFAAWLIKFIALMEQQFYANGLLIAQRTTIVMRKASTRDLKMNRPDDTF